MPSAAARERTPHKFLPRSPSLLRSPSHPLLLSLPAPHTLLPNVTDLAQGGTPELSPRTRERLVWAQIRQRTGKLQIEIGNEELKWDTDQISALNPGFLLTFTKINNSIKQKKKHDTLALIKEKNRSIYVASF